MQGIAQMTAGRWLPAMLVVAWALNGCAQSVPVSTTSDDSAVGATGTSSSGTSSPAPGVTPTAAALAIQGTPAITVVAGTPYYFQPTLPPTPDATTFSIANRPAWAMFSTGTGALYGVPPLTTLGTTANVTITASSGANSASIGPFDITVTAPPAASTSPPTPPTPPTPAPTGTATLTWVAPTVNTNGTPFTVLAGYHIYYGTSATQLSNEVTLTGSATTTYVVTGLATGTYYFAVTAISSKGTESARSNLASKTL